MTKDIDYIYKLSEYAFEIVNICFCIYYDVIIHTSYKKKLVFIHLFIKSMYRNMGM